MAFYNSKLKKKEIMCICKPKKCEIFNFWKMKSHKVTQSHNMSHEVIYSHIKSRIKLDS